MSELFEFPERTVARSTPRRPLPALVLSERVGVASPRTGKTIEYARLSDADHQDVRDLIVTLWDLRTHIHPVLDQPSDLYGSRGGGKAQTFRDILRGFADKMHKRHPVLRGRIGEDLTIKQLGELNRMIDALNDHLGSETLRGVVVP